MRQGKNENIGIWINFLLDRYPPEWSHNPSKSNKMVFHPVPVQDTWKAMESLVSKGLVRNIGVSNWNCQGLRDLLSYAKIKPSVLGEFDWGLGELVEYC